MAIANLLSQILYSFNMIRDVSEKKKKGGGGGAQAPSLDPLLCFL